MQTFHVTYTDPKTNKPIKMVVQSAGGELPDENALRKHYADHGLFKGIQLDIKEVKQEENTTAPEDAKILQPPEGVNVQPVTDLTKLPGALESSPESP